MNATTIRFGSVACEPVSLSLSPFIDTIGRKVCAEMVDFSRGGWNRSVPVILLLNFDHWRLSRARAIPIIREMPECCPRPPGDFDSTCRARRALKQLLASRSIRERERERGK